MAKNSKDIKRKISSVNNTKQITKAMELVSTAKLKRTRRRFEIAKPYYDAIYFNVINVLESDPGLIHPFLKKGEVNNRLYIVITGDRGLCGGYNINAIKLAEKMLAENPSNALITVGKKATDYFANKEASVIDSFIGISEKPSYRDAHHIASAAIEAYSEDKKVEGISLIFTEFKSTIEQNVRCINLLPFVPNEGEKMEKRLTNYEPSTSEVLTKLIPMYVESTIYGGLLESSASEQASRRIAMENATSNAEEMIDDLKFAFNQARQAAITQEISEIVGGAEALK